MAIAAAATWATSAARGADTASQPGTKPACPDAYPPYPNVLKLQAGDPAPDFSLPGADGKTYSLASFKHADVLAVLFLANHCPTSQMCEDRVIALVEKYRKRSFALVAISPNDPAAVMPHQLDRSDVGDSLAEMTLRAREKKYNFPYLYDGRTQATTLAFGPAVTPHLFVFDKARKLRYDGRWNLMLFNERSPSFAANAIDALLAGKTPRKASYSAYGSPILWGYLRRRADQAAARWNRRPVTLTDLPARGVMKLIANDGRLLRVICFWSLDDRPTVARFPRLVALRRIYQYRPFELIIVNADPPNRRNDVLAFLKKHYAAAPVPSTYRRPNAPPAPGNVFVTGPHRTKLPPAGRTLVIMPGGEVLHTHAKTLDIRALRKQVTNVFTGAE